MNQSEVERLNAEALNQAAAGQHEQALGLLERAIHLEPQSPSLVCNYAVVLGQAGDSVRAQQILLHVAGALPHEAEAWIHLGRLLLSTDREQARPFLMRAAGCQLRSTQLRCLLAQALMDIGELVLAAEVIEPALQNEKREPALALAANIRCLRNRADEALDLLQSVDIPEDGAAWMALARAKKELGDITGALAAVGRALEIDGERPELLWNRALLQLTLGQYEDGWQGFESRWDIPGQRLSGLAYPAERRWRGEPLAGKTLLVWEEQGFGDTLQFIRYVDALSAMGARVVIEARQPLQRLLVTLKTGEVRALGEAGEDWDLHVPTMSLSGHLWRQQAWMADRIPYFSLPSELLALWNERLGEKTKPRIGLVWEGGKYPDNPLLAAMDGRRSIPLEALTTALAGLPCEWFCLQNTPLTASWPGLRSFAAAQTDFLETAALIARLDAVVAVDTAVAHLAGALGKPIWLLSRIGGCWRWGDSGNATPWYPTMRVIRQTRYLDWGEALANLAAELAAFAEGKF